MQYFHVGNRDDLLRCRNCFANFFDAKALLLHESECFPLETETLQLISFPAYSSISFEAEFGTNNSTNLVPLIPPAEDGNVVVADYSAQACTDHYKDVYVKIEQPLDRK